MRIKIFTRSKFIYLISLLAVIISSQITDANSLAYRYVDHVKDNNIADAAGRKQHIISLHNRLVRGLKANPAVEAGLARDTGLKLMGNRFITLITLVRVNQIEISRYKAVGEDESGIHSPGAASAFREAVEKALPGARITWAFSWLALKDNRPNYQGIKKLAVFYHEKFGDEITFAPGGYFSNMYNTREQVNRDLHEGLQMVSQMVGAGYRPSSIIAGFLAAENLRFLAEKEGIHICQGNIWSQYAIDNGDGDGSISYPYYPSRQHFLKAAQDLSLIHI